jgi:hypothetical protein
MELGEYGMTYLLRLSACLFLCVSLNSFAGYVTVDWSGHLENIVVGDTVNHPVLSEGGQYSGTVVYSDEHITAVQDQYFNGAIYTFNSSQASLDADNGNMYFDNISDSPTLGIYNGITCGSSGQSWDELWSCDTFGEILNNNVPSGSQFDAWLLQAEFGDADFMIEFASTDDSVLTENVFLNEPPFGIVNDDEYLAVFWIFNFDYDVDSFLPQINYGGWGYLDEITITQVPLPAGITLFLSGLVGLGLMRGRRSK